MRRASHSSKRGFTIVELLIVVVVIAILASITVVAYSGIRRSTIASVQKSDLQSVAKQVSIIRTENSVSFKNPSLWKQALINSKLYDSVTPDNGKQKSMLVCTNDEHYVLGGWEPYNDLEKDAVEAFYMFDGLMRSFKWNQATEGASTIEKFCRQVSDIHGFDLYTQSVAMRLWMHHEILRNAPPL